MDYVHCTYTMYYVLCKYLNIHIAPFSYMYHSKVMKAGYLKDQRELHLSPTEHVFLHQPNSLDIQQKTVPERQRANAVFITNTLI